MTGLWSAVLIATAADSQLPVAALHCTQYPFWPLAKQAVLLAQVALPSNALPKILHCCRTVFEH